MSETNSEKGININQHKLTLEDFVATVSAENPGVIIDSTSNQRNLVRKGVHSNLAFLLEFAKEERLLSNEQLEAINAYQTHVYDPEFNNKSLTEKDDVVKALSVLSILGFDVSKQEKQLEETW